MIKNPFDEIKPISYNYDITLFRYHLLPDNIVLAQGFDVSWYL